MASLELVSKTETSITVKIVDLGQDCTAYSGFEIRISGTTVGSTSMCYFSSPDYSGNMTASGLTAGTSYTIDGYAYTNDWYHAGSGTWITDSEPDPAPEWGATDSIYVGSNKDGQLSFSWPTPGYTDHFEIVWSGARSGSDDEYDSSSKTFTGLGYSETISISVKACNSSGCSGTISASATTDSDPTPPVTDPGAPSLIALVAEEDAVLAEWEAASEGTYSIEKYYVRIYENCALDGSGSGCEMLMGDTIFYYDTNPSGNYEAYFQPLSSLTYYEVAVWAVDTEGNEGPEDRVGVTTLESTPDLDPPTLDTASATLTTATITYNTVSHADEYRIDIWGPGVDKSSGWIATPSHKFEGLANGETYSFDCQARDNSGDYDSSGSVISSITTDIITWDWTALEEDTFSNNGDPKDIPYTSWNGFIDTINLVREDRGYSPISTSAKMTSSDKVMTADRFNLARNGINDINSTTITTVSSGDPVMGLEFLLLRDDLLGST